MNYEIKIVCYLLSQETADAMPSDVTDRVPPLDACGDGYATRARAYTHAEATRLTGLGLVERDLTEAYAIGWTPAPRSYDHGYTFTLEEREGRRLVAVPLEEVEAQCGRYASGLYGLRLEAS